MDRYFKKLSPSVAASSSSVNGPTLLQPQESLNEDKLEADPENIPSDPGKRPDIMRYPSNSIERVRRAYLLKGPCQPREHDFPPRTDGKRQRKFVAHWFDEFKDWLEYSITKDAAYCLYCYLFSRLHGNGQDAFVSGGFTAWRKKESEEIDNVVLKNAPANLKLTSSDIQKDIINAASVETTKLIVDGIGDNSFSILVDECRDVSVKEQMGVAVRYVDKNGCLNERLLGIVHVSDTVATTLEKALDSLLSTHGLSVSSLRGQGYDGASNMRGEFNGLKSLILKRNPSAYYVHCFAHQLQLTIVAVAKKHTSIGSFFNSVTRLCNIVGSSCKRRDVLRESQRAKVVEGIASDEINTGRGLNQEKSLTRPGDTHWSSHYGTLINLMHLFSSINDVLEYVGENGYEDAHRAEALDVQEILNHFEFIFVLHLMRKLLGITHDLSQVLQKKDQDIVNAMNLVKVAKTHLQVMREKG
ncbi:zinc finger MYM-type protein 1-like [Salvia splendens]|uniref:zinc finger MYM-type protein 1-like n=1 Tax=Salvia splendens TaxID=180675 RepID=UPI001C2710C4|nr:zinc finger MYM-type protein 1-like [Salvia splendens]